MPRRSLLVEAKISGRERKTQPDTDGFSMEKVNIYMKFKIFQKNSLGFRESIEDRIQRDYSREKVLFFKTFVVFGKKKNSEFGAPTPKK